MDLLTAIAIARALAGAIEDGIPIVQRALDLLKASDEPEAKAALAELEKFYHDTGVEADDALVARLTALRAGRTG